MLLDIADKNVVINTDAETTTFLHNQRKPERQDFIDRRVHLVYQESEEEAENETETVCTSDGLATESKLF